MRLRHIEIFQALLQVGTLTGAAKLLHVSQPAATKLLQQAERELGFALFSRQGGRLQLSGEGALLRDKIENISDQLRELQRLSLSIRDSGHQHLRVVSTPTLANAVVPQAISLLRRQFPEASIELLTEHSQEMQRSLLLRENDVGLTLQEMHHPGLQQEKLLQGRLMAIAPAGWWNKSQLRKPLRLADLAGVTMIGIAVRDSLGRALRTHLQYLQPEPKILVWVQTYQLAKSLVLDGQGVALVDPFTALGAHEEALQVRALEPALEVPLYAVTRTGESLTPIQQKFLDHVRTLSRPFMP
ncbi:MAG: LysR substrate-binding domain-containing protein [Pseudoxanthomonas sp.]